MHYVQIVMVEVFRKMHIISSFNLLFPDGPLFPLLRSALGLKKLNDMLLSWSGSNPPPPPPDWPNCNLDGSRKLAWIWLTLLGSNEGMEGLPLLEEVPPLPDPPLIVLLDPPLVLLDPPLIVLLDPPLPPPLGFDGEELPKWNTSVLSDWKSSFLGYELKCIIGKKKHEWISIRHFPLDNFCSYFLIA